MPWGLCKFVSGDKVASQSAGFKELTDFHIVASKLQTHDDIQTFARLVHHTKQEKRGLSHAGTVGAFLSITYQQYNTIHDHRRQLTQGKIRCTSTPSRVASIAFTVAGQTAPMLFSMLIAMTVPFVELDCNRNGPTRES